MLKLTYNKYHFDRYKPSYETRSFVVFPMIVWSSDVTKQTCEDFAYSHSHFQLKKNIE